MVGNENLIGGIDYGRINKSYDNYLITNIFGKNWQHLKLLLHLQSILKDYPAIGECTNGWIYLTFPAGEREWKLYPEIRATLQCTKYYGDETKKNNEMHYFLTLQSVYILY